MGTTCAHALNQTRACESRNRPDRRERKHDTAGSASSALGGQQCGLLPEARRATLAHPHRPGCVPSRSVHMYNLYLFVKIDSNLQIVLEIYNVVQISWAQRCTKKLANIFICTHLYKRYKVVPFVQRFTCTNLYQTETL